MSTTVSVATATALSSALKTAIEAAGDGAYVEIYTGTRPASGGLPSGDPQIVVALPFPCGVVNVSGALQMSASEAGQVQEEGVPTWARIYDGVGTRVLDCGVRLSTGTPDGSEIVIETATATLFAGAFVAISGGTFGFPT